jgi:hemolysin III
LAKGFTVITTKLKELPVEELANTITHGFGLLLSIIGFVVLVAMAAFRGSPWLIVSCAVYGISLVVLYAASTFYHSTTSAELKRKLQILDHCCIYLLIAGSYTPFGLVILRGSLGWSLLVLIWTFALFGTLTKVVLRNRFPVISVVSYLVMGWIGAFAIQPLFAALGIVPIVLAIAGGLAYTFGVIFFAWHSLPHNHAIFHVFVLAGSILHYLAVIIYVVPAA